MAAKLIVSRARPSSADRQGDEIGGGAEGRGEGKTGEGLVKIVFSTKIPVEPIRLQQSRLSRDNSIIITS